MKLYGVLVLLATLSTAYGLQCYVCGDVNSSACTQKQDCPAGFDRCASAEVGGRVARTCGTAATCIAPVKCCEGDLCNGDANNAIDSVTTTVPDVGGSAIATISSVLLLLVSSAITSVFL